MPYELFLQIRKSGSYLGEGNDKRKDGGGDLTVAIAFQKSFLLQSLDNLLLVADGDCESSGVIDTGIGSLAVDFHVDFPQLLEFIPLESGPPVANRDGVVSLQLDLTPEIRKIRQNYKFTDLKIQYHNPTVGNAGPQSQLKDDCIFLDVKR